MGLPWKPHLFVDHLLCAFAPERKTQGKRAALESFVLCSFQVADFIFVVSVQVCQFVLAYHEPGYQENVPEEKKTRARSWSLGLYHEHESADLICTARQEAGPRANREHRAAGHRLGGPCWPGAPLTTCPRGWGAPGSEAPGSCTPTFSWLLYQLLTNWKGRRSIGQ